MQELDYLVTADDIAHLNHYHMQTSPTLRRRRVRAGMVVTLCGALGFMISLPMGGPVLIFMAVLTVIGVWAAMGGGARSGPSRQHVDYVRKLYEEGKNRALFGHHHVRLLPDRVEVTTEHSRGEVKWEGIERVVEDKQYIFIYVSALNAYVINKKYFPSEQHARAFLGQAQSLHQRALQLEGGHYHNAPLALPAPEALAPLPHRPQLQPAPYASPQHHSPRAPAPTPALAPARAGTDGSV